MRVSRGEVRTHGLPDISGATPLGAVTSTTLMGKLEHKKDMPRIMAAHNIPYIATVTPSYPTELYEKFKAALAVKGTRYIHILVPCPPGWGFDPKDTVKIGKIAVQCGIFDLFEIKDGKFSFYGLSSKIARGEVRLPVDEYLKAQTRYGNISSETIRAIQASVDQKWEWYESMGYCG